MALMGSSLTETFAHPSSEGSSINPFITDALASFTEAAKLTPPLKDKRDEMAGVAEML